MQVAIHQMGGVSSFQGPKKVVAVLLVSLKTTKKGVPENTQIVFFGHGVVPFGFGPTLDDQGPQVLIHVSFYQGSILGTHSHLLAFC